MSKSNGNDVAYSAINQELSYKFNETKNDKSTGPVPTVGARHWQVLIYFVLVFIAFGFRVTLSVAIVAMTDPKASRNPNIPTYPEWNDKSIILSAFFWGYIIPQVFAGWAANRFGAKWFLVGSMSICSVLGILLPYTAAEFGSKGVMISRALQGLCQGFIFPSLTHLLSQWAPPDERSRLGTFAYAAGPFGTVIAMLITGLISASWYGWPMVFYLYGCLGLIWCLIMAFLGYNSPAVHPKISDAEKLYIEKSLGHIDEKATHKTPWKAILTSVPVWGLFMSQCGNNYCFWTLLTQIPSYMNHVMNFNIKDNSILSCLPYLLLWILSFVFSFTSDAIVNKNILSRTVARKIFNSIGLMVPAIALITLGFTRSDQTIQAVTLLIIAVGFNSACFSGWTVNHMDLSPNHAGTLMGLTNGFSQITGIIAPLVVQLLVTNEKDSLQWRVIFFLAAGTNITTAIIFDIFGSGDVQPWNEDEEE